jgi:hypothetical protein
MALELQPMRQMLGLADLGRFGRAAVALHLHRSTLPSGIQRVQRQTGAALRPRSNSEVLAAHDVRTGRHRVGAGLYPMDAVRTALTPPCLASAARAGLPRQKAGARLPR